MTQQAPFANAAPFAKQIQYAPDGSIIWNTDASPVDPNEPEKFKTFGPLTRDQALMKHVELQQELSALKERELLLRTMCAAILLRDPAAPPKKEGVNNVPLGNGYVAKVGVKINYTLKSFKENVAVLDAVDDVIERMSEIGNEGSFIAERIFKFTVDISVSEYKKLVEDAKTSADCKKLLDLVNTVLETKEATPTLEIKAPKGAA